jgi:hypothetical protein
MKKLLFFVILPVFTLKSNAQSDTLLVGIHSTGWGIEQLIDSLRSGKCHHLMVGPEVFLNDIYTIPKSSRPYYRKVKKLLSKRMGSFRILIIENPTDQLAGRLEDVKYDTTKALIYKIDFSRMRSLKEIMLIGDDTDDILRMPSGFFQTQVNAIHCYCLHFQDVFEKNVRKKAPGLNVEEHDCNAIWEWLDRIY